MYMTPTFYKPSEVTNCFYEREAEDKVRSASNKESAITLPHFDYSTEGDTQLILQ